MSEMRQSISQIAEGTAPQEMPGVPGVAMSTVARFLRHYDLFEMPFGVTPDPRFLYLGAKHREALAALEYGTETECGFPALIAEPGMGKTSLLFQYLERLRGRARTAYIFQTDGDSRDLMRNLLRDLGIETAGKDLHEMRVSLQQLLIAEMEAGRRLILVIDEAQMLDTSVLESVRLLSNFETPAAKLMQIVLAGQPELSERLARPSLSQFRQRISFFITLDRFTPEEVRAYIEHRLWVAGHKGAALFTPGAQLLVADRSEGIPRNINNICFSAMSLGLATNCKRIDREMIADVLSDLGFGLPARRTEPPGLDAREAQGALKPHLSISGASTPPPRRWLARVFALTALLVALGWLAIFQDRPAEPFEIARPPASGEVIRFAPPGTVAIPAQPYRSVATEVLATPNASHSVGGKARNE